MNVDQYAADAPPIRFVAAEKINPYQLLAELHDHALAHRPTSSRVETLSDLELATAVVTWWSRWQPSMIHAALRAEVDLADIADAAGLDIDEVVRRWRRWADVQIGFDDRRTSGAGPG